MESWAQETEDICRNCGRNKAHLTDGHTCHTIITGRPCPLLRASGCEWTRCNRTCCAWLALPCTSHPPAKYDTFSQPTISTSIEYKEVQRGCHQQNTHENRAILFISQLHYPYKCHGERT